MLFVFFLTQSSFSQVSRGNDSPPPGLIKEFKKSFPDADAVHWNIGRRGYSASFFQNGYSMKAYFSEEGEWQSTMINIPRSQVPKDAIYHYEDNYPRYRITDTAYHDEFGNSYYCLFVNSSSNNRKELHYDDDGNFIRVVNR